MARNRADILVVLERILPRRGTVLEVASGTGEHAVFFAAAMPDLTWQPSDKDQTALASIRDWRAHEGLPNLRPPMPFDVAADPWPVDHVAAVVAINFLHIAPWSVTLALLDGAPSALTEDGVVFFYGAMFRADRPDAPSNQAFDRRLRKIDPVRGVRQLEDLERAARERGLELHEVVEMPNNNLGIVLGWP